MVFEIVYENTVLQETAIGIADTLFIHGVDSTVTKVETNFNFNTDSTFIILGFQRYHQLPKSFIAVQTEQDGSKTMTVTYLLKLGRAALVWEYNPSNMPYPNDT